MSRKNIPIYAAEQRLGLEKAILSQASAKTIASIVTPANIKQLVAAAKKSPHCEENLTFDTVSVNGLMVCTDWNKNDDFFSTDQVWAAKDTPLYKPVNIDHKGNEFDGNEIIGVILASMPVTMDYAEIDENKMPDQPYGLCINTRLWSEYFPYKTYSILEDIDLNRMFMSMECLFSDFGYCMREKGQNEVSLIDRNEMTAALSNYLCAYGGPGEINIEGKHYRIGRWLKDFVFSGVAFTKTPAEQKAVVFEDYKRGAASITVKKEQISSDFVKLLNNSVLKPSQKAVNLWANLKSKQIVTSN